MFLANPIQVEIIGNSWLSQQSLPLLSIFLTFVSLGWQFWTWRKDRIRLSIKMGRDFENEGLLDISSEVIYARVVNVSFTIPVVIREFWIFSFTGKRMTMKENYDDPFEDGDIDPEDFEVMKMNSHIDLLKPGQAGTVYFSTKTLAEECIHIKANPRWLRIHVVDHTNHVHKAKLDKKLIYLIEQQIKKLSASD